MKVLKTRTAIEKESAVVVEADEDIIEDDEMMEENKSDQNDVADDDEEGGEEEQSNSLSQNDEDDGSGEDDDEGMEDGLHKRKQKRRSKNDFQGRDHKCNYCDKTYLSYPALYTHMKNKHAKGPDGQPLVSFNSGRGRGRPKKNANMFPMAAIHNLARPQGASLIDPTIEQFFTAADKQGGPTDCLSNFQFVYTEIYIRKSNQPRKMPIMNQDDSNMHNGGNDDNQDED